MNPKKVVQKYNFNAEKNAADLLLLVETATKRQLGEQQEIIHKSQMFEIF